MSYADLGGQRPTAFDQTCNAAHAAAIRKYGTRDGVVLDLGGGLGVLGLITADPRARKVYLVEPASVVHGVRAVAERNGFGDCVVAIQGRLEDLSLPEKVDAITWVYTGNLLSGVGRYTAAADGVDNPPVCRERGHCRRCVNLRLITSQLSVSVASQFVTCWADEWKHAE